MCYHLRCLVQGKGPQTWVHVENRTHFRFLYRRVCEVILRQLQELSITTAGGPSGRTGQSQYKRSDASS